MSALSNYAHQQITEDDIRAVAAVLRSDRITQGPEVERFEAALCEYVGARHAVAVCNGTMALELAYRASGGFSFVTSPLSFVATANAALAIGGRYVRFCDVDQLTGNMLVADPDWQEWVVPVHFAGRACDLSRVNTLANAGRIIEDACQAMGAMDWDGCSRVGSCAHSWATVFSFHATKPITTGEGAAITTNDEATAQELRSLRDHGREGGLMTRLGTNGRMSDIQAALGLSQLRRCDEMLERRADLVARYGELLGEFDQGVVAQPLYEMHRMDSSAFHLYPVRIKDGRRGHVKACLAERGIGTQVHYDPPIHLHPYFRQRYEHKPGDFPEAEAWAAEALSLPLHAGMTEADVETVVHALSEVL